ncbi:MAG: hypothetical protein LAO22_22575 [Acidobacteriia bacterium]|nr:hypothetical protein [Terriglobia bacterium]
MAKEANPPKKGPRRMTTACKPETNEEAIRSEFEAELDGFAKKVHGAIQEARGKMTDEEVEKADREAKAILESATSKPKPSQHSA